eukprot:363973-Chlamydomonas_euryale.AAC.21
MTLLDEDSDRVVHRKDLVAAQIKAREYAMDNHLEPPKDWQTTYVWAFRTRLCATYWLQLCQWPQAGSAQVALQADFKYKVWPGHRVTVNGG